MFCTSLVTGNILITRCRWYLPPSAKPRCYTWILAICQHYEMCLSWLLFLVQSEPTLLYELNRWWLKNKEPTRYHLLYLLCFLDTEHVSGINMSIFRSLRLCCWTTTLAVLFSKSNTQQSKNNTANVVVQQHRRKLLKMDILIARSI